MDQSKLFWSRLQTLSVLNGAIFAGWWTTKEYEIISVGIIFLGFALNLSLGMIMKRDATYMEKLKSCAGDMFPECPPKCYERARGWAFFTIFAIVLALSILLGYSLCPSNPFPKGQPNLQERLEVQVHPVELTLTPKMEGKILLELSENQKLPIEITMPLAANPVRKEVPEDPQDNSQPIKQPD